MTGTVAVTGSHGLIGSALVQRLLAAGDRVVRIVRGAAGPDEVSWDPSAGILDPADLASVDAVVHLAGVGIAEHRWTAAHRAAILRSRVDGTQLLASTLARLDRPPRVLLSASAVGFYGDRGDEVLTEDSSSGTGYLADVCRQWEAGTAAASAAGIRVVHLRTGVVLSPHGGALGRQLPLFKFGVGGRLGSGDQYMSWIALEDHLRAMAHCIAVDTVSGPANLTAPNPVTNAEFTAALGRALHRPAVLRVPGVALRTLMGGEFADELLFASQRVVPAALTAAGYRFAFPEVNSALRGLLSPTPG